MSYSPNLRDHAHDTGGLRASVIGACPLALVAFDMQGRIELWNTAAQELFGWTEGEVLGQPLPCAAAMEAEEWRSLRESAAEASVLAKDMRSYRKGGRPVDVSVSAAPFRGADGRVAGIVAVMTDVTERKNLESDALRSSEAQLRQSQKMEAVGQLAGGIAHDFNNLLMVISGYSERLLCGLDDQDPLRRAADAIQQAADRAASLTRQLLAFSRRQVLQPRVIDLTTVALNVEGLLRRLIGENVVLVTRLSTSLGRVKADPNQVEQVLMNLALNARDAMPDGGTLTIGTADHDVDSTEAAAHLGLRPGRYVALTVEDVGTGMDEATQARIFEPFFTTKEPGRGTGLGLSTVYGIVKQSDGYISVNSALGRGTCFSVYLPRSDEPATSVSTRSVTGVPYGTETILVVEDEHDVRDILRKALSALGYQVLEAGDGVEAVALAESHSARIHLLLTDVVMPQMGAVELARRIRAGRPEIRVLFISGYSHETLAPSETFRPGAGYLAKPFTAQSLARKVREILDAPLASFSADP